MAKFYGNVGYILTEEIRPGVWQPHEVVRPYYGDILKMSSRWRTNEYVNDDITVSNRISIIADAYAIQNFAHIKYIEWMGTCWTVSSVDVEPPRLILSLGGVYSGSQTESA